VYRLPARANKLQSACRLIGQLALGSDELERGVFYVFQSTSGSFTLVTQHT